MAIPLRATEQRYGEVRLAKHGDTTPGLVLQADDPRVNGEDTTTASGVIIILDTDPLPTQGDVGSFAFAKDRKSLWFKEDTGWLFLGQLVKSVTESLATVVTPSGIDGTIQVTT